MKKLLLLAIPALALSFALAPAPQKRVTQEEPDFPASLQSAKAAWDAGDYSVCVSSLKRALTLATAKRAAAIRAALPDAPAGYTAEPDPKQDTAGNAMVAAMGLAVGNIIEKNYKKDGSGERIRVTVTADSPMVNMLGVAFSNPAMLGNDAELIEYEQHRAILKKEGNGRLNLQVLVHGKHVLDVQCPEDEDFLFAMFDQSAIDKVAAALGG